DLIGAAGVPRPGAAVEVGGGWTVLLVAVPTPPENRHAGLSECERDCLALLAQGKASAASKLWRDHPATLTRCQAAGDSDRGHLGVSQEGLGGRVFEQGHPCHSGNWPSAPRRRPVSIPPQETRLQRISGCKAVRPAVPGVIVR